MAEKAPVTFPFEPLTMITTVDGRYRDKTEDLAREVSEFSLIKTRIGTEGAYLVDLSDAGAIRRFTSQERKRLLTMGDDLTIVQARRVKTIETRIRHDVNAMKDTMRELFVGTSLEDTADSVHLAITSEDINNLSYRTMIMKARDRVIVPAVTEVTDKLVDMADEYVDVPMLGRTHGQAAVDSR